MKRAHGPVWVIYRGFVVLLSILPLPLARLLMAGVFRLLGPFISGANERMERSLKVAFPFRDREWRKARRYRTWSNLGRSVAESVKTRAVQRSLDTAVSARMEPELSAMRDDPRGWLLLLGHLGAWEVVIQLAPRFGRPVMGIFRPLANPLIERDLQKSRALAGVEMVSTEDPLLLRRALRHLRSGGMLALFVDQRWGEGEALELFEQPALCTLSPGLFQMMGEARVSTLLCRRIGSDRCEVVLESLPFKTSDECDDWRERGRSIMRSYNRRLEDFVKVYPDDWYWMQDRWKP